MVKVTVAMTTYNLQDYVEQAIVSVLNQKTSFEYKLVIADDSSTDDTTKILQKFRNLYPNKIDLILSKENLGSLKNSNRIFSCLKSDYFIFLDGDDYWIDDMLIQKLVEYLEKHPNCTMCGGNTRLLRDNKECELLIDRNKCSKDYNFNSFLENNLPFIHTSALMVRNCIFINGLPKCYRDAEDTFENCALRGEDFRRLLHLEKGDLHIIPDVLSTYRIHNKGIWQGSNVSRRVIEGAISANFYRKYFDGKYKLYFDNYFQNSYMGMWSVLMIDCGMFSGGTLALEEINLLSDLLKDLNTNSLGINNVKCNEINKKNNFKNKVTHKLMKLLCNTHK